MTISTMTTFRIKRKLRLKYEPLKYHKQLLWIGGSLRMLGYDPIVCYWGWNIVCLRTWLHPFGAINHHLVLNMIPWRKYCWFWRQELDITSHHYAIQDMDDSAPILFYPSKAWFRIKYYFLVLEDANLLSQEISMILAQSSFSLRMGILFPASGFQPEVGTLCKSRNGVSITGVLIIQSTSVLQHFTSIITNVWDIKMQILYTLYMPLDRYLIHEYSTNVETKKG